MKLYADESVDWQVVDRLRSDGHHVIAEERPGQPDPMLFWQLPKARARSL